MIDFAAMTREELMNALNAAKAELRNRNSWVESQGFSSRVQYRLIDAGIGTEEEFNLATKYGPPRLDNFGKAACDEVLEFIRSRSKVIA